MNYYIIKFLFYNISYYCIWHSSNIDEFIINRKILVNFDNLKEVKDYCEKYKISLQSNNINEYNIDFFINWLDKYDKKVIETSKFLNFWNIIQDVAYSINEHFYGDDNGDDNEILYVYNQLFYGTNPKSMLSDEDELYYPKWDKEDMQIIKDVVIDGIRILGKALDIDLMKEYKLIK